MEVPVENLRARPKRAESGPDISADDLRALRRVDSLSGVIPGFKIRLVLDRKHRHRHAFSAERLHRSSEISSEGGVISGYDLPFDEAARGFHPRRGAPWADHDEEIGVDLQRFPNAGQDILPGTLD